EALAFLYEIAIERNTISGMGLCGIGIPRLDRRTLPQASNLLVTRWTALLARFPTVAGLVVHLRICGNQIRGCLQKPFEETLRDITRQAGLGGISLGLAEQAVIAGNRIERNGRSFTDPVCGVFLLAGEDLTIVDNHIADNGPLMPSGEFRLNEGIRGGVV